MRRVSHFVEALVALTVIACGGGSSEAPPPAAPGAAAATETPTADTKAAPTDSAAPAEETAPAASDGADSAAAGDPDKRTMEVIAAVVKTHRKEARDCYEKAQKQIPGLKGDLVVHFVLKPSGKVKSAE